LNAARSSALLVIFAIALSKSACVNSSPESGWPIIWICLRAIHSQRKRSSRAIIFLQRPTGASGSVSCGKERLSFESHFLPA
jgi:hypothetical protein